MKGTILNKDEVERRVSVAVPAGTKVRAFGLDCTDGQAVSLVGPEVVQIGFLDRLRQHFPSGSTCWVAAVGENGIRFEAESWSTIVSVFEAASV